MEATIDAMTRIMAIGGQNGADGAATAMTKMVRIRARRMAEDIRLLLMTTTAGG